jgi:hypothetical protein
MFLILKKIAADALTGTSAFFMATGKEIRIERKNVYIEGDVCCNNRPV